MNENNLRYTDDQEVIKLYSESKNSRHRMLIMQNQNIDKETFLKLATDKEPLVSMSYHYQNKFINIDILQTMLEIKNNNLTKMILKNEDLPKNIIEKIMKEEDDEVRVSILNTKHANKYVLQLLTEKSLIVQKAIIRFSYADSIYIDNAIRLHGTDIFNVASVSKALSLEAIDHIINHKYIKKNIDIKGNILKVLFNTNRMEAFDKIVSKEFGPYEQKRVSFLITEKEKDSEKPEYLSNEKIEYLSNLKLDSHFIFRALCKLDNIDVDLLINHLNNLKMGVDDNRPGVILNVITKTKPIVKLFIAYIDKISNEIDDVILKKLLKIKSINVKVELAKLPIVKNNEKYVKEFISINNVKITRGLVGSEFLTNDDLINVFKHLKLDPELKEILFNKNDLELYKIIIDKHTTNKTILKEIYDKIKDLESPLVENILLHRNAPIIKQSTNLDIEPINDYNEDYFMNF